MLFLRVLILIGLAGGSALAQTPPAAAPGVEPGLEKAVKWKWTVVPSDPRSWGLPLPPPPAPSATATPPPVNLDAQYEVKRGDALIRIAKKFNITIEQLKLFNGLTNDLIRVGDILKIPTRAEAQALAPFPETIQKTAPEKAAANPNAIIGDYLTLQVYLDRAGFSAGPIDGKPSLTFDKIRFLYLSTTGGALDAQSLSQKAREELKDPLTHYTLKIEDFGFILPPKAQRPDAAPTPSSAKTAKAKAGPTPASKAAPLTYDELIASPLLGYRTPWEFVAERFHCEESLLRALNPQIKTAPKIGTEFQVPNVIPFEIETALREPIQPLANPQRPVTATILDLSILAIYQEGLAIAAMPVAVARPGLKGRGTWTILNAVPRPRLATRQELSNPPQATRGHFDIGRPAPTPIPTPEPLADDQYLPPGPNNPVGVLWLNLAKAGSSEPLPFGLHGTSIPGQMKIQQGLGGFRLTNWDIVRAARMLPDGTPLEWKIAAPAAPRPAAAAPAASVPEAIPEGIPAAVPVAAPIGQ